MSAVEQRLSVVTLGGTRLPRARSFYTSLGWVTRAGPETTSSSSRPANWSRPSTSHAGAAVAGEPGGYSGAFPDGHPWGVAPNPRWTLDEDGAVTLRPEVRRPHVRRRGAWRPTQTR